MSTLTAIFLIAALGYMVGSINLAGLKLGASGILLVALAFGHFGVVVPSVIKDLGLALFVGSVGFIAGPGFMDNFKGQAAPSLMLGPIIISLGSLMTAGAIKLFNLPAPLAIGMMTGALTSTPGLAAASEATGSELASIGYGIAYPFGVLGIVLFVQLVPKLLRVDMEAERNLLIGRFARPSEKDAAPDKAVKPKGLGLAAYCTAMVLGLFIAGITIPLPGGGVFRLGTSGGPLLAGLLFGHIGQIGGVSLRVPPKALELLREMGLMLFLAGAGTEAGRGFVAVVLEHGIGLFLIGAAITLVPLFASYIIARRVFKMPLLAGLGGICGGRTSTPALGALISVAETDHVAVAYAAAYPSALICIVLACQALALIMA
jgi:putative transport protein